MSNTAVGLVGPGEIIPDFPIEELIPAKVNDKVYRPIDPDAAAVQRLADDIRRNGLLEPILITTNDVILSGRRRCVACRIAGLTCVPVRRHSIHSEDADFVNLLVSCNTQREKTRDERLRRSVIQPAPDEGYIAFSPPVGS